MLKLFTVSLNLILSIVKAINRSRLINLGMDKQRLKELENEKTLEKKAKVSVNTNDSAYLKRLRNKYKRDD